MSAPPILILLRDATPERLLSADEERALHALLSDPAHYAAARSALCVANQRLVWKLARRWRDAALPFEDLAQEGNLGLLRAIETWDPERGRLSTYATIWITERIRRAIDEQSRLIRLPVHVSTRLRDAGRARNRLRGDLMREPTQAEVHAAIGLTPAEQATMEYARPAALVSYFSRPLSSSTPDGATLGDVIPAPDDTAVDALARVASGELAALLATIPPHYRQVLVWRYGIGGGPALTLAEIGKRINVTRERARQIEANALSLLRGEPIVETSRAERMAQDAARRAELVALVERHGGGCGRAADFWRGIAAQTGYTPKTAAGIYHKARNARRVAAAD